ncbi:uncharacterized protein LOC141577407 [Camelus bactrianus]|uniref:Uncharacterized protein LOC141577407 n=1 Tax=Camelus bactrianus TaxID=9837 RepID=A0AC58Q5I2_CAMBA
MPFWPPLLCDAIGASSGIRTPRSINLHTLFRGGAPPRQAPLSWYWCRSVPGGDPGLKAPVLCPSTDTSSDLSQPRLVRSWEARPCAPYQVTLAFGAVRVGALWTLRTPRGDPARPPGERTVCGRNTTSWPRDWSLRGCLGSVAVSPVLTPCFTLSQSGGDNASCLCPFPGKGEGLPGVSRPLRARTSAGHRRGASAPTAGGGWGAQGVEPPPCPGPRALCCLSSPGRGGGTEAAVSPSLPGTLESVFLWPVVSEWFGSQVPRDSAGGESPCQPRALAGGRCSAPQAARRLRAGIQGIGCSRAAWLPNHAGDRVASGSDPRALGGVCSTWRGAGGSGDRSYRASGLGTPAHSRAGTGITWGQADRTW